MEEFVVQLSHEEDELRKIIEPLLDGEGFELVRINFKSSQSKCLLGLFVDSKDVPNGITMANLEFISRFLSDVLDAASLEDSILRKAYDLEVSSPGLDRPLTKKSHFEKALNERIKLRLKQPDSQGSRVIIGRLLGTQAHRITVESEGKKEPSEFDLNDIAEAHIIFDFNKKSPSSPKNSKKNA